MIEVRGDGDDLAVLVSGKEIEILDVDEDHISAECKLTELTGEQAQPFPIRLDLQIQSENGFGTYFFHEVHLSEVPDGVALSFHCHTPNKYWEGQYGLATYLAAIREEVGHRENWNVVQ